MKVLSKKNHATPSKQSLLQFTGRWKKKIDTDFKHTGNYLIAPVQVTERKDAYIFFIYKPGLKPRSLVKHLSGNLFSITAEQSPAAAKAEDSDSSQFEKCFNLPDKINKNKISIRYRNDVVKVFISK